MPSRIAPFVVATAVAGCDVVYGLGGRMDIDARQPDDSVPADQSIVDDAPAPLQWSTPQLLFASGNDDDPTLTGDLLQIYFNRNNDIFWATRTSATGTFSMPIKNELLSSLFVDTSPRVSRDGRTMYFASERTGSVGQEDIFMATRASSTAMWSNITRLAALNTVFNDSAASPTTDMLELVMHSKRRNGVHYDLYRSTRTTDVMAWSEPMPITELNTPIESSNPMLSEDGLTIYFDSNRDDAMVQSELYIAHRASRSSPFGTAVPIAELNSVKDDRDPWISPDGNLIVFSSDRGGALGLWYSVKE